MDKYKQNARWLTCFAPFRALSISAAYLTPFFLDKGLSLTEVFLLQSVFAVTTMIWEIPSGYLADKFGRAFCIKLSAPIAAAAILAYGFSDHMWQFVILEAVLATANGLFSGVDTALLLDSLKAEGKEREFVRISQRVNAAGFVSTAVGVPIAMVLVHFVSFSATLVADGVLMIFGSYFAFRLVEAPRFNGSQEAIRKSAWHAMKLLARNIEARWLVALGATLSTATYLAFWLSAPYYTQLGISAIWFGAILAVRGIWKAWLSHRFTQERHLERNMVVYAALAGSVYFAMASGQPWLIVAILGHDIVYALHTQPISAKLNEHMPHEFRATLNSMVNLVRQLTFSIAGPLLGLLVDKAGLAVGFTVLGVCVSAVAFVALARLHRLKTFNSN